MNLNNESEKQPLISQTEILRLLMILQNESPEEFAGLQAILEKRVRNADDSAPWPSITMMQLDQMVKGPSVKTAPTTETKPSKLAVGLAIVILGSIASLLVLGVIAAANAVF